MKLAGGSYTSQSVNADAQKTVNLYVERIESGDGVSDAVLYPTPGLKKFAQFAGACLSIAKTPNGTFTQGQNGATYNVVVSNGTGAASLGLVTVIENVPTGLTFVSMSGAGWTIAGNVATRTDALLPAASYPALTVTVNVASNAPASVTNSVSISGGGCAQTNHAENVTAIVPAGIAPQPVNFNRMTPITTNSNGFTYPISPNVDIHIGDIMFYGLTFLDSPSPYNITSITDTAGNTWIPLCPAEQYLNPPPHQVYFQMYYAVSASLVPAGSSFTLNVTLNSSFVGSDSAHTFHSWRWPTALDQTTTLLISGAGTPKNGTPITTSVNTVFISFISCLQQAFPTAPLSTASLGGANSAFGPGTGIITAAWNNSGLWTAPPGTYNAQWNASPNLGDSVIVNVTVTV